ncbi:universal stress protein [Streptomyces aidingensis]|uniref:Nucleotide-binding universal stress protein, UspA family n=1 Tax=Streptomyces aidingensis TaxID=910347 RepID=A0A1I1FYK0_9ACTN|nr:universal stress protein [Streptomyces aidingensis]SFC02020.1 Nucleotide-binding universal stress protein, UspA family [Streptomyces aidingensis]
MNGWELSLVLVGVWVLSGLTGTALMLRQGYHHPLWFLWGVLLGPLAAPVLLERAEDTARLVSAPRRGRPRGGLTVIVGVDGGSGSHHSAEAVRDLLGPRAGRLILTKVVDFDTAGGDGEPGKHLARTERALLDYARGVDELDPVVEVVAGRPADALLELARQENADLIVVGPPHHMFGGTCRSLVLHSPIPVLVAPARSRAYAAHRS